MGEAFTNKDKHVIDLPLAVWFREEFKDAGDTSGEELRDRRAEELRQLGYKVTVEDADSVNGEPVYRVDAEDPACGDVIEDLRRRLGGEGELPQIHFEVGMAGQLRSFPITGLEVLRDRDTVVGRFYNIDELTR